MERNNQEERTLRNRYVRELSSFAATIIRYIGVGGMLAILYALLTAAFIEFASMRPVYASICAFLLSIPLAYFGHRNLSFRSHGSHKQELPRFVATMVSAFTISSVMVLYVVEHLHWHYGIGLLVTTVLVPLANFTILYFWVFFDEKH